jgi:hypothetical protein
MALIGDWPVNAGNAQSAVELVLEWADIRQWLKDNPVAARIVNDGTQNLTTAKSDSQNLQSLLSNMCAYGRMYWEYSPGDTNSSNRKLQETLRGTNVVTDCESLVRIFCQIAIRLGFRTIDAKKIERPNHRLVTKPGMVTFDEKTGDESLEGRWCFGDHWVAVYQNVCYDPTFNFQGFNLSQVPTVYLGWYAKEMEDRKCYTTTYWQADRTVPGSRHVYIRSIPKPGYTFRKTDRQGKEV